MADASNDTLPAGAARAMQAGRKIEAIRIVREELGLGLKEAKERVESASGRVGGGAPQRRNAREDSSTLRLVAVLVLLGGLAAAVYLL
ncbi:MAG: ribosomal protein L7/L12 [Pseudomonadales bacterium]